MERKYLKDCSSIDEVKMKYKGYVEKYLPRKGHRGNRRIFRAIEKEYESIRSWQDFSKVMSKISLEFTNFQFLIKELVYMGLEIEMCSNYLLVTGPTGMYEEDLTELGFQYSPVLGRWYYRPLIPEIPDIGNMNIIEVRDLYGSDKQSVNGVPVAKTNPQGRGDKK
jgi:hypothetical protein